MFNFTIFIAVVAQTLPTPRKYNHSDGGLVLRQGLDTSFNLPFGGRCDLESDKWENNHKSEARLQKIK